MRRGLISVWVLLMMVGSLWAVELETLFAQAERDPKALVPLLRAGSAAVRTLDDEAAVALARRLDPIAQKVLWAASAAPGAEAVGRTRITVKKGDTLGGLARRHRVGLELLQRFNPKVGTLQIGQRLTVLDAATRPVALTVDRQRFVVLVWLGDLLAACRPAGVGAEGRETPLGSTTVALRVRHPEWRDPDTGRILKPNDPDNVLGGYWLGFAPGGDAHFKSIGIHGYTKEDPTAWLGKAASHGCVRLRQTDIADVFNVALPGTPVTVR